MLHSKGATEVWLWEWKCDSEKLPMSKKSAVLSRCEAEQPKIRTDEAEQYIEVGFVLSITT